MMNPNIKLQIAIVGFGSQAQSWALNLKDKGHQITIILRKDTTSAEKVKSYALNYYHLDSKELDSQSFDFIALLTPDHTHNQVLEQNKSLFDNQSIVLAHGYSYWKYDFSSKFPRIQFSLLAPKAIASELRSNFLEQKKIYAAITKSTAPEFTQLVQSLGITHPILSNFQEESLADLFSEQSLLCGLIPYAAKASYDTLVAEGIAPKIAYVECWHEVKLIADAMIAKGPAALFELISPNALLGAEIFKNQHVNQEWKQILQKTFHNIKNREFIDYESQSDVGMIRKRVMKEWRESDIQKSFESLD